MRVSALLCLCLLTFGFGALTGCSEFPDLRAEDSEFVRTADYPALVPLEALGVTDEDAEKADEAARLNARAEALRNRARRLKGDVITDAEKKRLQEGVIEG